MIMILLLVSMVLGVCKTQAAMPKSCGLVTIKSYNSLGEYVGDNWSTDIKDLVAKENRLNKSTRVWDMLCGDGKKTFLICERLSTGLKKTQIVGTTDNVNTLKSLQDKYKIYKDSIVFASSIDEEAISHIVSKKFDFILATNKQDVLWTVDSLRAVTKHLAADGRIVISALYLNEHDPMLNIFKQVAACDAYKDYFKDVDMHNRWLLCSQSAIQEIFDAAGLSILAIDFAVSNNMFSWREQLREFMYKSISDFGVLSNLPPEIGKKFVNDVIRNSTKSLSSSGVSDLSLSISKMIVYAAKKA